MAKRKAKGKTNAVTSVVPHEPDTQERTVSAILSEIFDRATAERDELLARLDESGFDQDSPYGRDVVRMLSEAEMRFMTAASALGITPAAQEVEDGLKRIDDSIHTVILSMPS